jgi:hypothetical protein
VGDVPGWAQVVLAGAALVTACGVLWTKVLYPLVKGAATAEVMFPLLQDLTVKFRDIPAVFDVLKEIVAQVRTDSGSSLLDTINRLEDLLDEVKQGQVTLAERTMAAARLLEVNLAADRQLAIRDREEMARVVRDLDRVTQKLASIESRAIVVADNLAVAQTAVEGVATDLAEAHRRADAVPDPTGGAGAGSAADAASRSPQQGEP